jgi:Na+/H+ antiporter NhaD/arsenite permease-like protein
MKMLLLFAVIALTVGFRAKKLDRWTVLVLGALIMLDILFAYRGF